MGIFGGWFSVKSNLKVFAGIFDYEFSVKLNLKLFARILGCGFSVKSKFKMFVGILDCGVSVKSKFKLFVGIFDCGFSVKLNLKLFVGIFGGGVSVKSKFKPFVRIFDCGVSVKSKLKLFAGISGEGFSVKSKFSEMQAPCDLSMDCYPAEKNSPQKKKLELFLQAGSPLSGFFSEKEGCGNEAVKVIQSFKLQHVRGAYQATDITICRCPQSLSLMHLFSSKIHLKSKILHKNDKFYIFCKFTLFFDGHLMYH